MNDIAPAFLIPGAAIAGAALVSIAKWILQMVLRRSHTAIATLRRTYRPAQVLITLVAVRLALIIAGNFSWRDSAAHGLLLACVAAGAWLATRFLYMVRRGAERKYHKDIAADSHLRQRRTQIMMMYRTAYAGVWLVAVGIMFMTFPSARAIGASLLASAGVAGVVVGLAAQAMLKNLFAGLSLAFGDAIRLGDIVVVEGEYGKIEDIRLSYVVMCTWDERRLVLPTSYFTDFPHRNWSRESPQLLGTIELDVSWRLPVDEVREEVNRIVSQSNLWDGRLCSVLVTSATGPHKRIRPLISASNADDQWGLRCLVREKLIDWIVKNYPDCLPQLIVDTQSVSEEAPRVSVSTG